jgi:membrane dipeptidase
MYEKEYSSNHRHNYLMVIAIIACIIIFIIAASVIPILALVDVFGGRYSSDPATRAQSLISSVPLIDGHNDLPTVLYELEEKGWNFNIINDPTPDEDNMIRNLTGSVIHTTIPRLEKTRMGAQFWSTWVSCAEVDPLKKTFEKFSVVYDMVKKYPNSFEIALSTADIWKAFRERKVASLFGIEGGHSIANSIHALKAFYALGARYMTLTHTCNTPWCDSANGPLRGGLNDFGKQIIKEMNDMGMMVDLSHVSDRVMSQVLEISTAPVIFSHSGARSICNHIRNVPDEILKVVKQKNGVVMVPFYPIFVSDVERKVNEDISSRFNTTADQRREFFLWQAQNPTLRSNVTHVVDHIDYIKRIASIDNIGFGADFDGIPYTVKGLEDVSKYPEVVKEMIKRGYSNDDIKKVLGLNLLRVFEKVESLRK